MTCVSNAVESPPFSSRLPRRCCPRRVLPRPPRAASLPSVLAPDLAFLLLLAPLAACPSSQLASCINVKSVAVLASCVLRSGSSSPPHDHPSSRRSQRWPTERPPMVDEGVDRAIGFLRPFVMLAFVKKGDAPFATDLIGALAAPAAAAAKPGVMIPMVRKGGSGFVLQSDWWMLMCCC